MAIIAIFIFIPISITGYAFASAIFAVKTGATSIANIVGTAGTFLVTIRAIITGGALVTIGASPAGFAFIAVGTGEITGAAVAGTIAQSAIIAFTVTVTGIIGAANTFIATS